MTAQLSPTPIFKGWSNDGQPLAYGRLTTYKAGTTIKQAAYTDSTQTQQLTNPAQLDFRGETPLWLDPSLIYKFVLTDLFGNTIPGYPVDNIPGGFSITQSSIGFLLYPQTPQELAVHVTPTNYFYAPYHIGDDVRRYGNIDLTGTADSSAILETANLIGVALYFPPGIYRVANNLTLNNPCIMDYGAILKPDLGIVITITGQIMAGPWQIFDITNTLPTGPLTAQTSLQTGFTPISGPCAIEKCYAEWFGAIGNGTTDDFPAAQAACNFSMSSHGIPVQFQAKKYYFSHTLYGGGSAYQLGTASGGQGATACSIYGISTLIGGTNGIRSTLFTDNGSFTLSGGQPILRFRNLPSYDQHNEVRDITFDSIANTSNAIAIEWAGICSTRAVNCRFSLTGLYEAVRWNNTLEAGASSASIYTEYCILEKCEIFAGCINAVGHFLSTTSNDPSFHGCGFESRCIIAGPGSSTNIVILIDAGADWYNGILDCQIFGGASNFTVIQNNSAFTAISVSGRTTLEVGALTVTMAQCSSPGISVFHTGDIRADGPNVIAGTMVRCRALVNAIVDTPGPVGAEANGTLPLSAGSTTLTSTIPGLARDMTVTVTGTNYFVIYRLYLFFLAPGGQVVNLYNPGTASTHIFATGSNFSSWGDCTFSVAASGQLIVTNANFTGTVNAIWSERQLYAGAFGAQTCYL